MSECFKAGVSNLLKKHLLLYLLKFSSHGQMFFKKKETYIHSSTSNHFVRMK